MEKVFLQNSIGIDVRNNRICLGWIRGSLKGVAFEGFETYDHDAQSKQDILSQIDVFLSEFIETHGIKDFHLFIGIPEAYCLIKEIELPFSVRDDLASVLAYEIEKYIPMPASSVVYGFRVTGEDKSGGTIKVLLQVLKKQDLNPFLGLKDFIPGGITAIVLTRSAVEEYEAHVQSGKKPYITGVDDALSAAGDPETIRTLALAFQNFNINKKRINFLPERFRKKPSRLPIFTFIALFSLCIITLIVMGSSYYLQGRIQNRQLDARLSELKQQVQKAEKLTARIDTLEKKSNEIEDIMVIRPSALDILKELTLLIPQDTSLKEFEFKKQIVRIKGNSTNASRLVEPLEASPLFSGVGFESKITIKENNQESFIIKMKYEPKNEK